jgi:hypothetical protein
MICITQQIYATMKENGIINSLQELSVLCGKKQSYLRSLYSKRLPCSLDAMLVLYASLHRLIHQTTNPAHAAIMSDMQRLLWLNIETRATQKLDTAA